jgi:NADH:ubiquinone oxidoreductase subunit 2 (subunit N)
MINNILIVVMAIINSILALGGYLYILKIMLFDEPEAKAERKIKVPIFEGIALCVIIAVILLLGFWPNGIITALTHI